MAILEILKYPHAVLKKKCDKIERIDENLGKPRHAWVIFRNRQFTDNHAESVSMETGRESAPNL